MSDALLTAIVTELKGLRADLKGVKVAPAAAGAATPPKPAAGATKPATAPATAPKPAATAPKPGTTATAAPVIKGPGKYNSAQVRAAIQSVATNKALGKQSAKDILDQDGGGVTVVSDVKPEFYDAVVDACNALLSGGEAAPAEAEDDDIMA